MIISSLFFLFGFLTCMNDILVPHLKKHFTLNYTEAMLVQFSFFMAYFVVSIPSSRFCERFSYQTGMWVGLLVSGVGTLGFYGSAHFASFGLFLMALFVLAAGITLIQVAANPYVTLLGAPGGASQRLVLVQALNSLGTTIAPILGSRLILESDSLQSIEAPYVVMAIALVAVAFYVLSIKLPVFRSTKEDDVSWSELFRNTKLMLGCLGIFAYVGAEVAIGSILVNWLSQGEVLGISEAEAGRYVSFYWGGAMVGRFAGGALMSAIRPTTALRFVTGGAFVLVVATLFGNPFVSTWAIIAVGFCNSIMFPTIFSQSIAGLKRGTEKASGLLCTSIVGGALIPLLMGRVADLSSLRMGFIVPAICYVYLFYLAARLHREAKALQP